jgi:hypothetical protein
VFKVLDLLTIHFLPDFWLVPGGLSIMKKRIAAIIIAPIIGAVLGYLLIYALDSGWFRSNWQMIEKPPGEVLHLVALSRDSLWVQSDKGVIYYNEDSSTCKSSCWKEVPELPTFPIVEPYEAPVTDEACAPSPPLSGVTDRISECRRTLWIDYDFSFALRRDGNIYLWQTEIYKEWEFMLLIIGVCGGTIALFIPTAAFVLFLELLDWLSKRARKTLEEKMPDAG